MISLDFQFPCISLVNLRKKILWGKEIAIFNIHFEISQYVEYLIYVFHFIKLPTVYHGLNCAVLLNRFLKVFWKNI